MRDRLISSIASRMFFGTAQLGLYGSVGRLLGCQACYGFTPQAS
jgi:hypothetical protein